MRSEYPKDWAKREIGDFAKATGGSRFPPAAQGNDAGDYPFYKVSDMNLPGNERIMGVANNWITETTRKKIKARTFPVGSVIFPKIGAAVATNKKRLLTQESIIDNNVMAIVVDDPEVCAFSYLRFWFETIDLRDLSNSGALPSIPGHRVHTMPIPLPPLPEQKKIAHILSTVQRAIEAQERIIQTTTELFKSMLHQLMTAKIRATNGDRIAVDHGEDRGVNDSNLLIEPLPPGWKNHRFGEVCDRVKDSRSPVEGGETPYVGLEHLAQDFPAFVGQGTESDIKSSKTAFKIGDVLFGKLRPYLRKGAQADFDGISSTDILVLRAKNTCASVFLKYLVHSDEFIDHAKSTTSGVQHPRTSWPSLREFRLSLPPLPEQKKIAHILSIIQQKVDNAQSKKSKLEDLFRTLLHELMTAKRRVHELEVTE